MPAIREYVWAESVGEALRLRSAAAGLCLFVAGGTTLLGGGPDVDRAVDISRLGLSGIDRDARAGIVSVGATATLQAILEHEITAGFGAGLLALAMGQTRTRPWREHATLGGCIFAGTDANVVLATLCALRARAVFMRDDTDETPVRAPLESFVADARDALLLAIELPDDDGWTHDLQWLSKSALDAPIATIVVSARLDVGCIAEARITTAALGAASPLAQHATRAVVGLRRDATTFAPVQEALGADIRTFADVRASAAFRERMAVVLLGRALRNVLDAASSGGDDARAL